MNKEEIKNKLSKLIELYKNKVGENGIDLSEEMVRSWINDFLGVFGWDVKDKDYVLQEKILDKNSTARLREINSKHKKPDYTLTLLKNKKAFLDAKKVGVDIFNDKEVAFQIRSYGWSAKVPCSFVTNFEQFVIYDCRFFPNVNQSAKYGTIQLSINEYIDNFDVLYDYLFIGNVLNGNLERIYDGINIEGKSTLDEEFNKELSIFRLNLANEIYANNEISNYELNFFVQIIMNRILFIRVCESRGLEPLEKLKEMLNSDFWKNFCKESNLNFNIHYDGPLFFKFKKLDELKISNLSLFEDFINSLYYPSPYKFDIIPTSVISNIYEDFLSKELLPRNGTLVECLKEDYTKTNGAVPTPKYIVDGIVSLCIDTSSFKSIGELLKIKILDPCCGSGIFMVSALQELCSVCIELFKNGKYEKEYENWFVNDDEIYLTMNAKRQLIINCIYGIDYDLNAVEVTKMSLALKIIDDTPINLLKTVGAFDQNILHSIQKNILLGNTLVEKNIEGLSTDELISIRPINIKEEFNDITSTGGFDYIIGNPPYVETKYYKSASSKMHEYLSNNYDFFEGKADLSVLFIEKCLKLLNDNGKLNFIIQKRWFKTNYGKKIREYINTNKMLDLVVDFKATDIFKNRITYVSILQLSKKSVNSYMYSLLKDDPIALKYLFESGLVFNKNPFDVCNSNALDDVWSFESNKLNEIISRKKNEIGTLGALRNNGINIKDGIQVLYKKIYHLTKYKIEDKYVIGYNGLNELVKVELDSVKPVIYNQNFYCCKEIVPGACAIFPYKGDNNREKMSINEIKGKWPLLYKYLEDKKSFILDNVECNEGEFWHTYTREHNHESLKKKKIIIPMTAKDTFASVICDYDCYMDNSNVWFISIEDDDVTKLKAMSMIINSTVYSVFAKAKANPQQNDYFKFNKQFLIDVPFPISIFEDDEVVVKLSIFYDKIFDLQNQYIKLPFALQNVLKYELQSLWDEIDMMICKLYNLTEEEIRLVNSIGRIDRIEIIGDLYE
ncbi:MAG: N-6 DNA methylase [Bacilli bacterium]|nr:N-6 DNA methylase [Bacilli bacterium]